jgi:cellulose synthase/poly-beta-1,6-N-acetylglucosamine synthase-like glycosyltransferase
MYGLKNDLGEHLVGEVSLPTVSVVIAAFSLNRWGDLREAVASVRAQTVQVLETVVVIDHNPELMAKAASELPEVTVVANAGLRGASGARNTGVAGSRGQVLAFLDDDAVARSNWLEALLQHFTDPSVVGVGGRLEPLWKTCRPRWFPLEFDWAVGCSYRGMPESAARVRNVWSNNMAIRRRAFDAVGGFRIGFGKVGARSRPEDTDLCLRAAECNGGGIWIYEPNAIAGHQVPAERTTLSYFLKRCYYEGQGKAALASFNGVTESTSTERQYARHVLPHGVVRGLLETARGEASGMARSCAIIVGLSFATAGFLADRAVGQAMARCEIFRARPNSRPMKKAMSRHRRGVR